MRVLVYAPYGYRTPHFEIQLEAIQRHLDQGDSVSVLTCGGELSACDANPEHLPGVCFRCRCSRAVGLDLLTAPVDCRPFLWLTEQDHEELAALPAAFPDVAALKRFRFRSFDAGYAALSSLVCLIRDPDADLVCHADLVSRLLVSACTVYCSLVNHLRSGDADRVYVFNAREAPTRGVLRACQEARVECHVLEIGGDFRRYNTYVNTLPHDRHYVEARIREAWDKAAGNPARWEIGSQWFEERPRGIDRVWKSQVSQQSPGMLPAGFDARRRNIVVFPSSEDEFVAVGDEWNYPFYATQVEGLRSIFESVARDPRDLHFYIRMHPNLAHVQNARKRELEALAAPFVTVIPAEDPISSYALLRVANKVLTFGSTLGIEAVYWGVPSILAGLSYFVRLNATYNPASHAELVQLLYADLPPRDRELAVIYGYYFATLGTEYRYYQPDNLVQGRFNGVRIRPRPLQRVAVRLYRVMHSVQKRLARSA